MVKFDLFCIGVEVWVVFYQLELLVVKDLTFKRVRSLLEVHVGSRCFSQIRFAKQKVLGHTLSSTTNFWVILFAKYS